MIVRKEYKGDGDLRKEYKGDSDLRKENTTILTLVPPKTIENTQSPNEAHECNKQTENQLLNDDLRIKKTCFCAARTGKAERLIV